MVSPDPDAALMVAFQGGDESAFRSLFEKYGRSMISYCNHYVRDRPEPKSWRRTCS